MSNKLEKSEHRPVIKIVGIYMLFGTLWIFFSDSILGWLVRDPDLMTRIAIYKGMMYILLTAALLYTLIYRHVYQDALSRKKLLASEERTRLFFERQIVGMAITSPEKGWIQVNNKLCQMLGYSAEELRETTWEKVTHPDDIANSNQMFGKLLSGKIDDYSIEKRFIRKDGAILCADVAVGCVRHNDGTVNYVLSLLVDITERKQAEAALKDSEELFSKAFNSAPVMMMISEQASGVYQDVNSRFTELSGYSRDEVIGKTAIQLGWLSMEEWEKTRNELKLNGHCTGQELKAVCKDGQSLECLCYCEPITVNGQQRVFTIMLDVTEQRKLEKQLRQALKMESIGRLAGGVAHDFNNKLSVILGYAEIAKNEQYDNPRLWHQLDEISMAALHSRDITRQLLAFSRQDLITPKQLDLNDSIRSSQNALKHLIGEDIIIHFQPGEELWMVKMDPVQLDQIVMNLAVNSRDAMPDGGIFTIVTSNIHINDLHLPDAVDARPGDFVCISFTDTGVGIDKEILRNIFEPFFTTKGVGKGTGLGLATVYGIISQNAGFIEVSSQAGQGTTFNIYLPRMIDGIIGEQETSSSTANGSGTIMVVEDEESVRRMIVQMLKQLGYDVIAVGSPQEAIDLFRHNNPEPDLILTDVIMPGLSGREMIKVIESVHPGIKVLYMSGYTPDMISQKGIFEEKANFIHKPFNIGNLNETIKRLLQQSPYMPE